MLAKKSYATKDKHAIPCIPTEQYSVGNLCITRNHDNSFNVNEIFGRIQSHRYNMPMFFLRDTRFSARQSTRMFSDSGWHVGEEKGYQCNVGAEFNMMEIVVFVIGYGIGGKDIPIMARLAKGKTLE